MAALQNVFPTKMDDSRCSGFASKRDSTPGDFGFLFFISSISLKSREKRATSDPEIKAEVNSRMNKIRNPLRNSGEVKAASEFPARLPK